MNNKVMCALTFVLGAAAGAVVTWGVLKEKMAKIYAEIADEEIEAVKEYYAGKYAIEVGGKAFAEGLQAGVEQGLNKKSLSIEKEEFAVDRSGISEKIGAIVEECDDILNKNGYVNYSDVSENKEEGGNDSEDDVEKPYMIPYDEYGELYGYHKMTLTYYSDGVLADDESDEIVSSYEIDETVGLQNLEAIGRDGFDEIHVRNDAKMCDYEIVRSLRTYTDVMGLD